MKILMVHPNWKAYSEVWLHRMINYLEDDIVGMACFSPLQEKWNNKIECFDLYGKKKGWLKRKLFRFGVFKSLLGTTIEEEFISFVREKKPEIIFINFIGPALYLKKALDQLRLPVFIHVHGVDIFWDAKDEMNGSAIHDNNYKNDVYSLASGDYKVSFIANSMLAEKQLLANNIPAEKIHLKYFGIETGSVEKVFRDTELRVLFLGRFVDFKGPDIVVNAFIKACDLGFNGVLTMAGDGPLKLTCQLIARRSEYADRIIFTGAVNSEKAKELFKQSDIYTMHNCWGLLSNMTEAFGVTVIEAMGYGVPVITGNCGGPVEIITNKHDGILVEPGDVDGHASAFLYLQRNPAKMEEMSRNCVDTIRKRFSLKQERNMLQNILAGYKNED